MSSTQDGYRLQRVGRARVANARLQRVSFDTLDHDHPVQPGRLAAPPPDGVGGQYEAALRGNAHANANTVNHTASLLVQRFGLILQQT